MLRPRQFLCAVLGLALMAGSVNAAEVSGLTTGSPDLKSAGPLAFGPEGVLLVGDTKAATVFAIATGDTSGDPSNVKLEIKAINKQIAKTLGTKPNGVRINDLAVNPLSGNAYLSVSAAGKPAIVRVSAEGTVQPLELKNVRYSKAALPDPPEDKPVGRRKRNRRNDSITDIAFVEGQVIVSGLSGKGKNVRSTVRALSFPPSEVDAGAQLEIYHGAHGRFEDNRAARTVVPFKIGGELHVLAAYTCTPLVKFPVSHVTNKPKRKTRATTVAELGNRNRPLDMISYKKDGKDYLLLINDRRGVMKISTENIQQNEGITTPVKGGRTAGQKYETIKSLQNVVQLDKLSETTAVILVGQRGGPQTLRTIALP